MKPETARIIEELRAAKYAVLVTYEAAGVQVSVIPDLPEKPWLENMQLRRIAQSEIGVDDAIEQIMKQGMDS